MWNMVTNFPKTLERANKALEYRVLVEANFQVGMNGDTFSTKAAKECSKKFAGTFKGKFLNRGNVLRIFFFVVLRRVWGTSIEKVLPLKLLRNFGVSKTLFLKAFWSLKINVLD